jgi:hypothetical protein
MKHRLFVLMTALAVLMVALAGTNIALQAETLEPIRQHCTISVGDKAGTLRLETGNSDCHGQKHCGSNMSDLALSRLTGIAITDLAREGGQVTATLAAEAGTFTCSGTVAQGELVGHSVFTPDAGFQERMEKMGFSGYDSNKLLAYAFLDVQSGWAQSLKEMGIRDMNADNLIALRVFHVDPAYVRGLTGLGYPLPTADQLVALSCQGVNAEEVGEIRALGYQPTLDQLIQIRIFKITPDFIHRMQARGLKNLTIDKLVQIRIFKLAD